MVSGLTTAAGLWVVAAIGLACCGGLYKVAVGSSVLVLVGLEAFNYFLHKFNNFRKE
jgi:putative Mg2+ transporter-C (MgtC) family protein